MAHTHEIIDSDKSFVIDPITRVVSNNTDKVKLVQFDHNSERFTFQCPRMIEGHDMSQSTAVRVQYININKKTKETSTGVYAVKDLAVSSDNPNTVTFSWLISRNATKYVGSLSFLIEFVCTDDDTSVVYAWHTDICKYITVVAGMDNAEVIEEKYPDILEQWKNEIIAEIPSVSPHPITRIESLDETNIVTLRSLDSGTYVLYGYFKPFEGATSTMTFASNILVSIVKRTSESHIQIFYPYNNCVQYVTTTDSSYERKNVYLNDLLNTVQCDKAQSLTDEQKAQARDNIGAVELADIPEQAIPKIESLDESNIKTLRGLEDGPYVLSGYFVPYTGADSTFIFDPPAIVSISSTDSATHVQIFEPYNNQIQHLVITDTTCESSYVLLNDIAKSAAEIGNLSTLTTTAKDTLVDAINEAVSDITFTVDAYVGMEKTDITVDKTPAEIYEAYTKGLIVTLNLRSDTQKVLLQKVNLKLSSIKKSNDKYEITFSNLVKGGIPISYALYWNGIRWIYERDLIATYDYLKNDYVQYYFGTNYTGKILGIQSDGNVGIMDAAGSVIPSVTTSDNGKILQVVNGAWAAAAIPNAEEGSF